VVLINPGPIATDMTKVSHQGWASNLVHESSQLNDPVSGCLCTSLHEINTAGCVPGFLVGTGMEIFWSAHTLHFV